MNRPSPTAPEPTWSRYLATVLQGEAEAVLAGGVRCDILTAYTAWEVDWAKKWPEAIGQACLYGVRSNRPGGVILLTRRKPNDGDYLTRAADACRVANLLLMVFDTR